MARTLLQQTTAPSEGVHYRNSASNPSCDSGMCLRPDGELRVFTVSAVGRLVLCQDCFNKEMTWRKHINELMVRAGDHDDFPIPEWTKLPLYNPKGI